MKSKEEHFTMTTFDIDSYTIVCFDSKVHPTLKIANSTN